MKYRHLGSKGPVISTVGFGAWGISGRDWGKRDDENSRKDIHAALDAGVNFIDTADVYGFGHSEELIRQALDERADNDYSVKHLEFAAEQSLKRLNIEASDVFPDWRSLMLSRSGIIFSSGRLKKF